MVPVRTAVIGLVVATAGVAPAFAQSAAPPPEAIATQRQSRYQIGQMERMLEGAVEHGAAIIRDRLQLIVPSAMLISENAHVRGFRLDGYGLFFDVEVPSPVGTMAWSLRTLDQNDLGLQSALNELKKHVAAAGDANLEQALKRVELQLGPIPLAATLPPAASAATISTARVGSPAMAPPGAQTAAPDQAAADALLSDPNEAYRTAVKQSLMEGMLDYSGPLAVGPSEWLTIAARRNDDRPQLAPADSDAGTMVIRIGGADLAAFRAGQLTREDALKRMDVRVF